MKQEQPILSLHNVGIYYKRGIFGEPFWALKDVSFDLYHGETLGIIGRNGVGKSTLLRMMAGIIKPNTGTFVNNGYRASLLSLQLGFIPYLSGRENAILSGML
ncbi:MAG TPA: ABC transporter ATP-binding protein, partial [Thioploca sp.]|nr:ABC transporter ATP-binding protein [Thioploca sp.]